MLSKSYYCYIQATIFLLILNLSLFDFRKSSWKFSEDEQEYSPVSIGSHTACETKGIIVPQWLSSCLCCYDNCTFKAHSALIDCYPSFQDYPVLLRPCSSWTYTQSQDDNSVMSYSGIAAIPQCKLQNRFIRSIKLDRGKFCSAGHPRCQNRVPLRAFFLRKGALYEGSEHLPKCLSRKASLF